MNPTSVPLIRYVLPLLLLLVASAQAAVLPPPPDVAGSAWILVDAETGFVITERNADERLAPASLTKLMTSYVLASELAAGRVSNEDVVQVSENAWAQNPLFAGSSLMWIEPGRPVSLLQLHRGVVISSGNDASVAIAEHLAGSESAFADMMNAHAVDLGMTGTHYVNSHGLPDPDHYTTARDLVLLAKALIERFPEEYALYKEREYTYNNIRQYNRNALLAEDPSVDGLKTGHTEEAGYCLVASAKRSDMRLISVVLGADSERSRKTESRKLLNYGFRTFETLALYSAGEELATTRVWKGQQDSLSLGVDRTIRMTIPRGSRDALDAAIEIDKLIEAPVARGDSYGALVVKLEGEMLLNEPLVALHAVEPPKIEFPCDYPVKVLGRSVPEFESVVVDVIERHAPGFPRDSISMRASREGTFVSLTVQITATGKPQLEALHQDLLATGLVQMVI